MLHKRMDVPHQLGRWATLLVILSLILTSVTAAQAAVNDLFLISRSTLNEPGDKRSDRASVMSYLGSADPLERSAFSSRSTNLIDGAKDNDCFTFQGSELCFFDIFMHDENNLATSMLTANTVPELDGDSYYPIISEDGNYVVFQSAVEDLETLVPPEETDPRETDIFLATLDANGNISLTQRVSSAFIAEAEPNFDSGYIQYGIDGFNYYPITYNNGATRLNLYFPHPVASIARQDNNLYIAYESMASNLVDPDEIPPEPPNPPGPPPHLQPDYNGHIKDIFVRQMLPITSDSLMLTRGYDSTYGYYSGNPSDGESYHPVLANGQRYLVFVSEATNLIPGFGLGDYQPHNPPSDPRGNVFWLDRDYDNDGLLDEFAQPESDPQGPGVRYYLVSHDNGPEQKPGNGLSKHPAVSFNITSEDVGGDMVDFENLNIAFQSDATNLVNGDTNGFTDIFLYRWRRNLTTGEESEVIERVSLPSAIQIPKGALAAQPQRGPALTLPGGQVPLEWGNAPTDALLEKPGHLAWSKQTGPQQLQQKDAGTSEDEDPMCNLGGDSTQANLASYAPSISRDGRIVAFHSYASNLIDGDRNCACRYYFGSGIEGILTKNCPDVYGRDWLAQQTWRMSVTKDGSEAQGDSVWGEFNRNAQFVYFSSYANLAGDDADGSYNYILQVFMRDQGNPPGNPNVQPTSWDFGNRHPFQYAEKTFRMLFLADLYVDQIQLDPLSDSRYSIFSDNCSGSYRYQSGDTCTFKVAFQADEEMYFYTGQINISLSDPNPGMPPTRTLNLALRANVVPWELYMPGIQR